MASDNRQSPVTSVSETAGPSGSVKAESGDRYRRIWDEWCTACGIVGLLATFALIAYGIAKAGTMLVIYVGSKRASDGIELQNRWDGDKVSACAPSHSFGSHRGVEYRSLHD